MHSPDEKVTDKRGFATKAVHAGGTRPKPYNTLTTSIAQTAVFTFSDTADVVAYQEARLQNGLSEREEYGRYGNPTIHAVERKLAELDRGEAALLFGTGMSALTTTLLTLLSAGDHMVMTDDSYRRTRVFCEEFLARFGVEMTSVPPGDYGAMDAAIKASTKLLFFESPTNPYLRVTDLPRAVDIGRRHGLRVLVDSSLATPYNQTPLSIGADLVIHSATKYLGGHNDLLAGVVVGSRALLSEIKQSRGTLGSICDPNSAYLLLRGLKTLGLRMERHNGNGVSLARFLEAHPKVQRVHYPGLESHPDYAVAQDQMLGYGGMVSFEVKGGRGAASTVVDSLRIPQIGPSFGGPESLVIQPALQTYYELTVEERLAIGIREELLRYSAGLEDSDDLVADLEQALAQI